MRTVWNPFTSTFSRKLFFAAIIIFGLVFLFPSSNVFAEDAPLPPDIEFSLPATVTATEKFDIDFTAKNIPKEGSYYVKFVAYPTSDETDKKHGCTFKEDSGCLSYTGSSWDKFPKFSRNDDGTVSGKITASMKIAEDDGEFKGLLRFALTTETSKTYYLSEDKDIHVNPKPPEPPPPEPEKPAEPDSAPTTEVETPHVASLPDDVIESSDPPTTLPTNTNVDIKLPATFSAQEVPKVAGASTTASEPVATPEAQATPSSLSTRKYVIILGSLGFVGTVITGIVIFLKSRGILK